LTSRKAGFLGGGGPLELKSKKEVSPQYFTNAIIKETFVFLLLQLKSKKQANCALNKSSTSKKTTPFFSWVR
jgi:hypothetical protein